MRGGFGRDRAAIVEQRGSPVNFAKGFGQFRWGNFASANEKPTRNCEWVFRFGTVLFPNVLFPNVLFPNVLFPNVLFPNVLSKKTSLSMNDFRV